MSISTTVSNLALKLSVVAALVMVLLPFHAFLTTWADTNFNHLDLIRIWKEIVLSLCLPLVIWLVYRDYGLRQWFIQSWVVRLFALYVMLHLVLGAIALSDHELNASAFIYSLIINLRFIGFFILCALLATRSSFLVNNWRKLIMYPAAAVIIFGILQVIVFPIDFLWHFGYGPETIPAYQTVDSNIEYQRIQSTLRGANPLGAYLVLILPVLFTIKKINRLFFFGMSVGAGFVLFYTYSRSAWLGVMAMLLALGFISSRLRINKKLLAGGALVVIVLLAALVQGLRTNQTTESALLHTSSNSTVDVTSNEARLEAIKNGAKDIIDEPLGRGPGTAGPASFRNSGHGARISENYFLQVGQEVGLAGIVLIVGIMILVAKELWQRRNDELARLLLASFVGLTVINLISHAWTDDTLAYLWWGLAGVACAPALVKPKH